MNVSTDFTLSKFLNTQRLAAYYELTKPGITFTVLISMAVGFLLGSGQNINLLLLLQASIGTWLIASGTAAHNQFLEWRLDGQMKRTRRRPLPTSKISPKESIVFSLSLILGGLFYLIFVVNLVAGLVSLATTLLYLCAYTPLKRISAVNVFVGAVPGALPPVGGWAAATGHLGSTAMWLLFGIVFLWQVPHVLSIAWVCKDDYRQAGFRMLPKSELKTVTLILGCLILLLPISWGLFVTGHGNWLYLIGSLCCAIGFLTYGIKFSFKRSKLSAKKLMFASFAYLPLVWFFVVLDHLIF